MRLLLSIAALVLVAAAAPAQQPCVKAKACPQAIPAAVQTQAVQNQFQFQTVAVPTALFVVPGAPTVQVVQPQFQVVQAPQVVFSQPQVIQSAAVTTTFLQPQVIVAQPNVVVQQRRIFGANVAVARQPQVTTRGRIVTRIR